MFYGHTNVDSPNKNLHSCVNTGYCIKDLPQTMADRDEWQERVKVICVVNTSWWFWSIQKVLSTSIFKLKCHHVQEVKNLIKFKYLLSCL